MGRTGAPGRSSHVWSRTSTSGATTFQMRAALPLALCASRTGRATWGRSTRSASAERSHRLEAPPSH
eukprot:5360035-Prymnesium_polylepis.1